MTTATTTVADAVRIGVKLYAEDPAAVRPDRFIPVFHGWIQRGAVPGLLIDVADYAHVPQGPGVMLIGHEADHAIDLGEGRPGVLYQRKRDLDGTLEERIGAALDAAEIAAAELEADPDAGGLRFGRDELLVRILDRLAAPNAPATLEAVRPALLAALERRRPGAALSLEHVDDPKGPFAVRVRLSG